MIRHCLCIGNLFNHLIAFYIIKNLIAYIIQNRLTVATLFSDILVVNGIYQTRA